MHKEVEIELNKWLEYEQSNLDTKSEPIFESKWNLIDEIIEDFNKSIDQFDKLIAVEQLELKRKLFLQKTMIFLKRDDSCSYYRKYLNKFNMCSNFGKLFVTDLDYFSTEDFMNAFLDRKEL